jgi:hypothetical protein
MQRLYYNALTPPLQSKMRIQNCATLVIGIFRVIYEIVLDARVTERAKAEGKHVAAALLSLPVQNELLHYENNGLGAVLTTKQKHKKKSKVLARSEKRMCARQSNSVKKRRINSRKVRQGS